MNEDIKITRLPKILDPNRMMEEKIFGIYGSCPFCGENKKWDFHNGVDSDGIEVSFVLEGWYGKHDQDSNPFSILRFWEKDIYWKRQSFICHTCGAMWKSSAYPGNIKGY